MSPLRPTVEQNKFEFSDSLATSINKRTRSKGNELQSLFHELHELSASDHTLSMRICLYERLRTLSILM